ncbi:NDP-hexose 2,3-dehydratase, partial [Microbacterium sp. HSID17254]|uniref:NDP-hexose 2,3-dehydratase family protein n=1 Tax=Microbacterium sp. HSID17254 TaxID=2419509 RepID=UPI000FAEC265
RPTPARACASSSQSLPALPAPPLLDLVEKAPAADVRFDCVMAEEGGRFLDTETRYTVVETTDPAEPPGYLRVTVGQLQELLRHSHYLNVQARSLVTCLHSLSTPAPRRKL